MPSNQPRKQHFVPQVYLRNFANSNENLYVYNAQGSRKSHIRNVACERDFNEYKVGTESSNYRYEALFERFENLAGPITAKLLTDAELDYDETLAWSAYVACIFFRSRKLRNDFRSGQGKVLLQNSLSPSAIRDTQFQLLKAGHLHHFDDVRAVMEKQIQEIGKNPAYLHLNNFEQRLPDHAMLLLNRHWMVAKDASGRLVTSDAPVCPVRLTKAELLLGQGLAVRETLILLPLSPKKLFIAGFPGVQCFEECLNVQAVDLINRGIINSADKEVYTRLFCPEISEQVSREIGSVKYSGDVSDASNI